MNITMYIISFLIGRTTIFGVFSLFVSTYTILLLGNRRNNIKKMEFYINIGLVYVGLLSSARGNLLLRNTLMLLFILVIHIVISSTKSKCTIYSRSIMNFLVVLFSYVSIVFIKGEDIYYLVIGMFESSISYFFTFVLMPGTLFIQSKYLYAKRVNAKELTSILILISGCMYGIAGIYVGIFNLHVISIMVFLLIVSSILGMEYSILMAFIITFMQIILGVRMSIEVAMMLMIGTLLSSFFKGLKIYNILGFLLGILIMRGTTYVELLVIDDIEVMYYNFLISSVIFYLVPYKLDIVAKNSLSDMMHREIIYSSNYNNNNIELINIDLINKIKEYEKLRNMFKKEYVKKINRNDKNSNKILESNYLLYNQYKYLISSIDSMFNRINSRIEFRNSVGRSILLELRSKRVKIKNVIVYKNERNKNEVLVRLKDEDELIRIKTITKIINDKLDNKMEYAKCDNLTVYYKEESKFKIQYSVGILKKGTNKLSGDSYLIFEDKQNNLNITLCDGMGSGETAHKHSRWTIELYENFVNSGVEKEGCIELLNSVLLINENKEIFSSLDTIEINRDEGILKSYKVGASGTYIIRNNKINVIESKALPVGIVNNIEVEIEESKIRKGDIIVMMTDGVVESNVDIKEKDGWVLEKVMKYKTQSANRISEYIVEQCKKEYNGNVKDDCTVIVIKVE